MIGFRKQWKQQWVATWVAAKDQLHGRGKVCRAPTATVYHSSLCNSSEVCSPPFELKDGLPSRRTAATKCLLMKFWLCKKSQTISRPILKLIEKEAYLCALRETKLSTSFFFASDFSTVFKLETSFFPHFLCCSLTQTRKIFILDTINNIFFE